MCCGKTFVWKQPHVKRYKERHWFELWIRESYSIRQLSKLSGYSESKLKRIKRYWLNQEPPCTFVALSKIRHLFYDGTYFHKDGCFISLMEMSRQITIDHLYADKEGYKNVCPWFEKLKRQGLYPDVIIMDGERSVIRAIRKIWPKTKIQRCLYHIQREGMRWLRSNPKTEAGWELRNLLSTLCRIQTVKERNIFINGFDSWLKKYGKFVNQLPKEIVAFKDLKRTIVLIENALPDMFRYLDDPSIAKTTNTLESFYSRLKADYQRHRGLTTKNKIQYLKWYCFLKNSNTL